MLNASILLLSLFCLVFSNISFDSVELLLTEVVKDGNLSKLLVNTACVTQCTFKGSFLTVYLYTNTHTPQYSYSLLSNNFLYKLSHFSTVSCIFKRIPIKPSESFMNV